MENLPLIIFIALLFVLGAFIVSGINQHKNK